MATVVPTDGVVWLSRGLNPRQRARREAVLLSPRTRSTASTAVQVPNPNRACPSMCSRRVERELELWRADVVSSPRGRRRHVAAYTVVCRRYCTPLCVAPLIGSQRRLSVHSAFPQRRSDRSRTCGGGPRPARLTICGTGRTARRPRRQWATHGRTAHPDGAPGRRPRGRARRDRRRGRLFRYIYAVCISVCVGAIGRSIRCTGSLHPNFIVTLQMSSTSAGCAGRALRKSSNRLLALSSMRRSGAKPAAALDLLVAG